MDRKQGAIPISGVLAGLFAERHWEERLGLHQLFLFWDEVVGEAIARQARPAVIRGRVLWVEVTDSIWMQQLHLQKTTLLSAINGRLPGDGLSDIRFRLGRGMEEMAATPSPFKKARPKRPDPDKQRRFANLLTALPDVETRARLLSLWERNALGQNGDSEESG
ncbi:MAG: DUF721 domain-containing protein [Deltaproteobacteria bacterium CG_4_10_14_3_um_filter_60_8]|nr:MAG: hypothetical protein AUK28_02910 [Desulfobacterales bacterium CG2_30_60_27]PIP43772.1 MAG: hypothetical protein COX17_05140 [Deltaproteobacteria bacterium CG23_combo_of_CG06-09_8_20_14_all_60_8]PIY22515.1 MAG: DUF721 domain-containing protein [Deltaproteobacteria bacterium CG_4_10_14_3_um_filter_60_8]